MNAILLALLLPTQTWQEETLLLINEERVRANEAELIIYGEYQYGPRQPLKYLSEIEDAEQWWCDALRNTKSRLFDHVGYVNEKGFLIEGLRSNGTFSTKQIGNIWLPSYNMPGQTFWADRFRYLGIDNTGSSENGVLLDTSRSSPDEVVNAWFHGYNIDPRKARYHYSNLISPFWTHYGVAKAGWGKGKTATFAGFIREYP